MSKSDRTELNKAKLNHKVAKSLNTPNYQSGRTELIQHILGNKAPKWGSVSLYVEDMMIGKAAL
jgi:hypothetical protein